MDRAGSQGSNLELIEISEHPSTYPAAFEKRASVTLGNGILPLETGRRFQPLNAHNSIRSRAQTAFSPLKPLNLRPFPQIRGPPLWEDRMVDRSRIESRTTPRCALEFVLLEHLLWETELRGQRFSYEFEGSVLELRRNLGGDSNRDALAATSTARKPRPPAAGPGLPAP